MVHGITFFTKIEKSEIRKYELTIQYTGDLWKRVAAIGHILVFIIKFQDLEVDSCAFVKQESIMTMTMIMTMTDDNTIKR